MSSSSSASWLNACVGRGEWFLHLSPEQSLASIRAASGGASATEWEQNRPDCVGREALARDQVHLKPPLILQCAVELLYSPTQRQTPAWPHRQTRGCVNGPGHANDKASSTEQGRERPLRSVWSFEKTKMWPVWFCSLQASVKKKRCSTLFCKLKHTFVNLWTSMFIYDQWEMPHEVQNI